MFKSFHVTSMKSLGRNKANVAQFDWQKQTLSFIKKITKEETKKKSYQLSNLKTVTKAPDSTKVLSVVFSGAVKYSKTMSFQSGDERDLFYKICQTVSGIRDGLVWLSKSVKLFMQYDTTSTGLLSPAIAAQALALDANDARLTTFTMVAFEYFYLLYSELQIAQPKTNDAKSSTAAPRRKPPKNPLNVDRSNPNVETIIPMSVSSPRPEKATGLEALVSLDLLDGEVVYMKQLNASRVDGNKSWKGSFVFTSYRLHFADYKQNDEGSIDIPLGWIMKTDCTDSSLTVHMKRLAKVKFVFDTTRNWISGLNDVLKKEAFPENANQTKCFAFSYKTALDISDDAKQNGWNFYDPIAEYHRLGFDHTDKVYRISYCNLTYEVCPTYPRFLVVPSEMTDDEVIKGATHRSKSRLPAIIYRAATTGATLSRCSQPMGGMRGRRSTADERLISLIRTSNPTNSDVLYLMDARPYKAAVGNTVMGKGYENTQNYKNTELHFLNIDNIHVIRNCMGRVNDVIKASNSTAEEMAGATNPWMHYIRLILESSIRISKIMLEEGASVVIHCSDGWDRTSQLSALTMLMIDPYFRTRKGFAILVQKEWLSFGHKFQERYGQCDGRYTNDQRAPIFDQFLECVYQIVRQFPLSFEFNERFLLGIADHLQSCKYGTFLFDCDKARRGANLERKTVSLWTMLCHNDNKVLYSNPMYKRNEAVLYPNCSHLHLVLWEGYHYKFLIKQRLRETQSDVVQGLYKQYLDLLTLVREQKLAVDVPFKIVTDDDIEADNNRQRLEIHNQLLELYGHKHMRLGSAMHDDRKTRLLSSPVEVSEGDDNTDIIMDVPRSSGSSPMSTKSMQAQQPVSPTSLRQGRSQSGSGSSNRLTPPIRIIASNSVVEEDKPDVKQVTPASIPEEESSSSSRSMSIIEDTEDDHRLAQPVALKMVRSKKITPPPLPAYVDA